MDNIKPLGYLYPDAAERLREGRSGSEVLFSQRGGAELVPVFAEAPAAPADYLLATAIRNLPKFIEKSVLVGPDKHSAMRCFEVMRDAITAPQPAGGEAVTWRHPDEVPEVVPGGNAYFWVAVRRKHDGRVYSFPAQYLNAMLLCNEWSDDTERSGNRYHHGPTCEVEGSFPATGWHDAKEHGEYDCVYQPLLGDADELVAWREVASYPGVDAPPAAPAEAMATVTAGAFGRLMWTDAGQRARLPDGTKLYAHQQPATPEGMVLVPEEILDRFPELNPSNYDHDGVCRLNAWGVELVLAAKSQGGEG